jgi:hypothetical protein
LKSTEIVKENLKARTGIPSKVSKRAKELFGCVDEYSMRTEAANILEIDHRIPQVRWTTNEDDNSNLTDEQIKNWLNKNTYLDKAGAYAIQEDEFGFVNHIEGSYNNVVGFPIEEIIKILAELHYFPNKEL